MQGVDQADVPRGPLGAEVRLFGEERIQRRGVEARGRGDDRGHHLVADDLVGDRVDRDLADPGVPSEDALDGGGGEVLAVDPQPVVAPAGEVEEPLGVAIAEVAGPVPAVAGGFRGRLAQRPPRPPD